MPIKLEPIKARFNSKCKETGRDLLKGTTIYHDAANKCAYHAESETVKKYLAGETSTLVMELPIGLGKTGATNDFIQDPGEQAADNWAAENFI